MAEKMGLNLKGAVAICVITLVGASYFVGSDDDEGALSRAAGTMLSPSDSIGDNSAVQAMFGGPGNDVEGDIVRPQPVEPAQYDDTDIVFSDGDDLMDNASGFDPSPVEAAESHIGVPTDTGLSEFDALQALENGEVLEGVE